MNGTKIIAFANPKGSVGKSTTVAALAHLAAQAGSKVLVLDLDPQADITSWLGGRRDTAGITQGLRAAVTNDPAQWPGVDPAEVTADLRRHALRTIQHTPAGVDLICADRAMEDLLRKWADVRPSGHPELLLRELLASLAGDYDLVLLDCKGDLGVLSESALYAAHDVVGVATPSTKGMEGLQRLRAKVDSVGTVQLRAVIPVQVKPRNRGAEADDLHQIMHKIWPTTSPVRYGVGLDGAYADGQPITLADPTCAVSTDIAQVLADLQAKGVL